MKITRDNYESWFLDYLEGRLEEEMVDEFLLFVHENPDLKEELNGFEAIPLQPPVVRFEGKEKLNKDILDLPETFERAAIAYMEGDLDLSKKKHFENYLQHRPEKQKEVVLFQRTKLVPDTSIVYSRKKQLYHSPFIRVMMNRAMRVAAVLLVAALVYAVLKKPAVIPGSGTEVAQTEFSEKTGEHLLEIFPGTETENEAVMDGATRIADATNPATGMETKKPAGNIEKLLPAGSKTALQKKLSSAIVESDRLTGRNLEKLAELPPIRDINLKTTSVPLTLAYIPLPAGQNRLLAETKPESRPLNEIIMEKTGLGEISNSLNDLSLSKVTRFGLKIAATLSNDKFSYHTNNDGDIIAFHLDTKLLGLSIPVNK